METFLGKTVPVFCKKTFVVDRTVWWNLQDCTEFDLFLLCEKHLCIEFPRALFDQATVETKMVQIVGTVVPVAWIVKSNFQTYALKLFIRRSEG